jgi:hypothetical protein
VTKASPRRRAAYFLRRVLPGRKGNAVNPDQKASADLAKVAIWSEDSLGYDRKRGQRKPVWLLEAVKGWSKVLNQWGMDQRINASLAFQVGRAPAQSYLYLASSLYS